MSYPKLSIESLFHKQGNEINFSGRLNVSTLFKQENPSYNFNAKKLLDDKYKQRKNLEIFYGEIYKKCCTSITEANKCGFTKITYTIPVYSDYIGYTYENCIEFIKKHLEDEKLHVVILSKTKIEIIWDDLEQQLNKNT